MGDVTVFLVGSDTNTIVLLSFTIIGEGAAAKIFDHFTGTEPRKFSAYPFSSFHISIALLLTNNFMLVWRHINVLLFIHFLFIVILLLVLLLLVVGKVIDFLIMAFAVRLFNDIG